MNNKNFTSISTRPSFALIPFNKNNYGWFFSGFCHADGSFLINYDIVKNGINFSFRFSVSLGISSLNLIKEFKNYFGCGYITITNNICSFTVANFYEVWHIIIPHFIKYPMQGGKFFSFLIFTYCMSLCYPYFHVSNPIDVVLEIIKSSFLMNEGTRRTLEDYYDLLNIINNIYNNNINNNTNLVPYSPGNFNIIIWKPLFLELQQYIKSFYSIPLDFIKGVMEGDGSFIVKFKKGSIYAFIFTITTSINDISLLYAIQNRLNCGHIYIAASGKHCRLEVNKIEDLNNKIIPLIDSLEFYRGNGKNLLCSKSANYEIFREGIKKHLNKEISRDKSIKIETTANKIQRIETINFIKKAYNVFEGGKQRKLTLTEFLQQHNLDN